LLDSRSLIVRLGRRATVAIIEALSRDEAVGWAAKVAAACRCA
jgi:hypothetical protein